MDTEQTPELNNNSELNNPIQAGVSSPKNTAVMVAGVVFLIVVVGALVWLWRSGYFEKPAANSIILSKIIVQKAEPGQVVAGFPEWLVADAKAGDIRSAENVSSDPAKMKIVTSYKTSESVESLEKLYKDLFEKNNWIVAIDSKKEGKLSMIAFSPAESQQTVNINMAKETDADNNLVMMIFSKPR